MARRNKSKKAQSTDLKLPVRNPVAANPLLGKSQAHGKTRKANRRADNVSLRKMPFDRTTCPATGAGQVIGSNGILRCKSYGEFHNGLRGDLPIDLRSDFRSVSSSVLLAANPAASANLQLLAV